MLGAAGNSPPGGAPAQRHAASLRLPDGDILDDKTQTLSLLLQAPPTFTYFIVGVGRWTILTPPTPTFCPYRLHPCRYARPSGGITYLFTAYNPYPPPPRSDYLPLPVSLQAVTMPVRHVNLSSLPFLTVVSTPVCWTILALMSL